MYPSSMKKIILTAVFLSVIFQSSCSDENRESQSPKSLSETTSTLQILFHDGDAGRFSVAEKETITSILVESETRVRELLHNLPKVIDVSVVIIDRDIDVVGGVSGRADAPGKVVVELSKVFPGGISAAAQSALSSTIFHEFHHLDRGWTIQGNKFGAGIPIAAVNEGLACVFSEKYTGVYFESAFSYPEDAVEWLEEILALPEDADYSTWMMGEHPDGRNSIGYRVGRYIIHQATAKSGKDILELSKLSPNEILELAAKAAH